MKYLRWLFDILATLVWGALIATCAMLFALAWLWLLGVIP